MVWPGLDVRRFPSPGFGSGVEFDTAADEGRVGTEGDIEGEGNEIIIEGEGDEITGELLTEGIFVVGLEWHPDKINAHITIANHIHLLSINSFPLLLK
jgi:hypothetical protein